MAVCRVGGFGDGGCACGCASRPAENEENFTFFNWKRKVLLKDCKTLCFGKKRHCLKIASVQEGAGSEACGSL